MEMKDAEVYTLAEMEIASIEDARKECARRNAEEARKPAKDRLHWIVRDEGTVEASGIMGIRG